MTDTEPTPDGTGSEPDDAAAHVDLGISYADAVAELERILADLEADRCDIDDVTVKVARAEQLVTHCRNRVAGARIKLKIVADSS